MHQIHLQAEGKSPEPPKCLGPLFKACKFHQPIRDEGLLTRIESAANSLMDWRDQHATAQDGEPLTDLQIAILEALDGRALKTDPLAQAVCGGDRRRLYKPGGIKELQQAGKVTKKRGVGHYRPDRPPLDKLAPN